VGFQGTRSRLRINIYFCKWFPKSLSIIISHPSKSFHLKCVPLLVGCVIATTSWYLGSLGSNGS